MITEAQVFLTRRCNLNCGYCKLTKSKIKELDYSDWMKAYRIMEKIGIKTVKIMGGEPTVLTWLPNLLRFASRTSVKTALLSNSSFDDEMRKRIADGLPYGYFASVDSMKSLNSHKDPVKKSLDGYQTLKAFKNTNIFLLAANVVINKHNYKDIPQIVEKLSDENFWVNLCMVQHTTNPNKEFSKVDVKSDYLFTDDDIADLEVLKQTLLTMKRNGIKITVPEAYIEGITTYGIHCDWKCNTLSQLRIDCDGGLMLCNEFRTKLAEEFNILQMSKKRFEEFMNQWKQVRSTIDCEGCYWSCFIQAEDNMRNKKEEFHYLKHI